MIEIDRWPRDVAPLVSYIEDMQRKFEMRVLNRYELIKIRLKTETRKKSAKALCQGEAVRIQRGLFCRRASFGVTP